VRLHELGSNLPIPDSPPPPTKGTEGGSSQSDHRRGRYLARIEVGVTELARLLHSDLREQVAAALRKIGYAHVTVDLQGYGRGSLKQARVLSAKPG